MKSKLFIFLFIFSAILHGQSSKELLRDGLFAEESEGDLKVATENYESLLKAFEAERKVAAVALYRLAAVKRKQGEEKAALALYEEFGKKFGDVEPQATLVRENYLAISGNEFPGPVTGFSEEDEELARIKKLEVTSPDLFPNFKAFGEYVSNGQSQIVAYLLKKGTDPNFQGAIEIAASKGNLTMVQQLLEAGADPNHENNIQAFASALSNDHWKIAELLGQAKADLKVSYPNILTVRKTMELPPNRIDFLISHGADPNYVRKSIDSNEKSVGIPLQDAVRYKQYDYAKLLLKAGAKVGFSRPTDGVQALHYASALGDEKMIKILIEAGADPNALIQISATRISRFPKRFSSLGIETGKRPIDLIPTYKARVLLEAGAKFSPEVVVRAAEARSTELIDYLISQGADLNQRNNVDNLNYQLPLSIAFSDKNENMVEHLLSKGAKLSLIDRSLLPPKYLVKAARDHHYEKLTNTEKIHIVFPEISSIESATFSADFDSKVYSNLMAMNLPGLIRDTNRLTHSINYQKLTWNLVRSGKVEPFDLEKEDHLELQAGDIIEVLGFAGFTKNQTLTVAGTMSLGRIFCPFSMALRKADRFPIQISHAGVTHDITICPDMFIFDPRGNELPYGHLDQILNLLFGGTPMKVSIRRAGFPKFIFETIHNNHYGVKLKSGDHISIFPLPNEKHASDDPDLRRLENVYRVDHISARVKDRLGAWRWSIPENNENVVIAPTLLALIADINCIESESDALIEEAAFRKISRGNLTKILPGIDLNRIVIRRLEGEIEKEIIINLSEKIEKWGASQKKEELFDFQLQSGDIVEFTTHEGRWKGFSKMTNHYFEEALNIPLINQRLDTFDLKFKMPNWHSLEEKDIPITEKGTHSSIRGDRFLTGNSSVKVQRNTKELRSRISSSIYWPKAGDVFDVYDIAKPAPIIQSRKRPVPMKKWPPKEESNSAEKIQKTNVPRVRRIPAQK